MADGGGGGGRVYHRGAHGVESSRKGYGHLRDDTKISSVLGLRIRVEMMMMIKNNAYHGNPKTWMTHWKIT